MTNARGTVIIAGRFCFPEGDPASARVLGMAHALRLAGYEPLIGSGASHAREADRQSDGSYRYQGIQYSALDDAGAHSVFLVGKLRKYWDLGRRTADWVRSQDLSGCSAFVSTGGYTHLHLRLFPHLRRLGIPYVVDCGDWFGIRHTPGLGRFLQGPNTELANRVLNVQAGHIIAISKFFEDYYAKRGCQVVRVPPVVDLCDTKWSLRARLRSPCPTLRLVYAGTPGRKDQLTPVVVGLGLACQRGVDARLDLVGLSRAELAAHLGRESPWLDALGPRINFHSRVAADAVPKHLMQADFSVLVRPVALYSMAGFPTKVVESLAAGVPVICNRTSNIDEYVRDGVEGILLEGNSPRDFAQGLLRAASLTPSERERMRTSTRSRALACFDFRQYVEPLQGFFDNLSKSRRPTRKSA